MSLKLNRAKYRFFAFTYIKLFIFVVGNIFIVVLISHNIINNNHNLTTINMFIESIQFGRQEFVFSINGRPYDTLDVRN